MANSFRKLRKIIWGVAIAVLGGVSAGMVLYFIQSHLADRRARAGDVTRLQLQGTWVLEMKTLQTSWGPYRGLEISELVSLTVDPKFNVHGVGYKWWEDSKKGEILYPRARRTKSTISGSIRGQHVVLNWNSVDSVGRTSIQTLEGDTSIRNGHEWIQGTFVSDVAAQIGQFCAQKIDQSILQSESLPKAICPE